MHSIQFGKKIGGLVITLHQQPANNKTQWRITKLIKPTRMVFQIISHSSDRAGDLSRFARTSERAHRGKPVDEQRNGKIWRVSIHASLHQRGKPVYFLRLPELRNSFNPCLASSTRQTQ